FNEIYGVLKTAFIELDIKPAEQRLKELRDQKIAEMEEKAESIVSMKLSRLSVCLNYNPHL
ncbi:hypothetical protein BaRGS_00033771, partial [Batillaria attramentaria]